MDFVSIVRGSEYPPASHGVLFLFGDRDPLARRAGVCRGDGVGTAVEVTVVSPVVEGAELPTESLLSTDTVDDEFKSEVTSIVTNFNSPEVLSREPQVRYPDNPPI